MSKYINIVILYRNHFYKSPKTNSLPTDTLGTYATFEMGLPRFKGQGQMNIEVKKGFIRNLSFQACAKSRSNILFMFKQTFVDCIYAR